MRTTKLKKQLLLYCLFIFFSSVAGAQRIVNEIPVPFMVNYNVDAQVTIFTNKESDTACIFVTTTREAAGYIINKEQKLIQQFSFQRRSTKEKIISAFFANGNIVFLAGDDEQMTEYVYHFADHTIESSELKLPAKKELLMVLINANDALYIMSCVKDSSVLVFRTLSGFGQLSIDSIRINTNNDHAFFGQSFYETITTNHDIKKFVNYSYVSSESADVDVLNKDCKIYYRNDSIYITQNGFAKDVMLISFSPREPQPVYRKITTTRLPDCNMNILSSRFNSYLLGDKLYTVSACDVQMQIEAFDISSGARQLVETTNSKEQIGYAVTPIIQSVSDPRYGQHLDRTLDTKQLLHKMMDGNAVIKAEETNHDIKLTVGSYKEFTSIRGDMPIFFPVPGWVSLAGLTLSNTVFNPSNERITRFVSVWDKNTFAHRQGLSEVPLEDRLDMFRKNIKTYRNCETLYQMNRNNIYLYYNPGTQALTMVLF